MMIPDVRRLGRTRARRLGSPPQRVRRPLRIILVLLTEIVLAERPAVMLFFAYLL